MSATQEILEIVQDAGSQGILVRDILLELPEGHKVWKTSHSAGYVRGILSGLLKQGKVRKSKLHPTWKKSPKLWHPVTKQP